MVANTKIEWATHSFSPWLGCSKIAPGCANCYAAEMAGRLGVKWGPQGTRRRTAESTWKQVERWNRQARCVCGRDAAWAVNHVPGCPQHDRPRVFPSSCDTFEDWQGAILDNRGRRLMTTEYTQRRFVGECAGADRYMRMYDLRLDFFALIDRTPNLDWLLLTKRPENILRMWDCPECPQPGCKGSAPKRRNNVWLLCSASTQADLEAGLPHLLACRGLVPVLGLSLEPLLEPIDLDSLYPGGLCCGEGPYVRGIDWVIVGGESGPHARPCNVEWIRDIVRQCRDAGVRVFVKQLGAHSIVTNEQPSEQHWRGVVFDPRGRSDGMTRVMLHDPKGGDISEFPEDLRVQQFPRS